MNISLVEKDIKDIRLIKPLWEKLNLVHYEKSIHFKNKYENFTFDNRMRSINKKAQNGIVKIDLLLDEDTSNYVGYCISSIENNDGEIESIFIDENYRKLKLGDMLMQSALSWFESNSITNIAIGVVYDNCDALPFYEHYGFNISSYILKKI